MTEKGLARGLDLYTKLESRTATWKCLHPLFETIWELPDSALGQGGQDTYLLRFLAGAALKEDGTLMDGKRLVNWITHLKYGGRAFCMVEGVENVDKHAGILE